MPQQWRKEFALVVGLVWLLAGYRMGMSLEVLGLGVGLIVGYLGARGAADWGKGAALVAPRKD